MKKFLQNFKMWMVALFAMIAGTAYAQDPDATISFVTAGYAWNTDYSACSWTANGVTAIAKNFDDNSQSTNTWAGELNADAGTYGWVKVISEERAITKIVVYGGQNYVASVGSFDGDTWTGSANDVVISTYTDEYLKKIDVYLEAGDGPTGGPTGEYATIVSVSPAEGEISLDENQYGSSQITITLDGAWDTDVYAEKAEDVAAKGIVFTTPEGDQAAPKAIYMWEGSSTIALQFGSPNYAFMTPGTYTLSIPANLNTMGGKGNPAATYTWTVTGPSKFEFGWNDAQPQGTKKDGAGEYDPFKTLTGFKLNAPEGVVFDHLADDVKLQTKEYDRESYEAVYTDVEGATVALVDGVVVVTFAEAITEQGYHSFVLAEGSIFATDKRYNKEVSLGASVNPYSYFDLDLGNEPFQGLEFKTPFNTLTFTVPADVTATKVGETFVAKYNGDITLTVTGFEQKGQEIVINFTGGDAVPVYTETEWFGLEFPQGFVKTADEFYLSNQQTIWNNKLVEAQVEPDPNEQTYADWKKLVTEDMKAVYDAYETCPTEDVVGKKPADVTAAVWNYYYATDAMFYQFENWEGIATGWEAAVAYFERYGKTLAGEYAAALEIWNAYENAELVSEPEEVTLVEEGVATGAYYDYYGNAIDLEDVPVAYEMYSDGSIVLKNFWNTGKDLTVRIGEPYEYQGYNFANVESIDDVEDFGSMYEQDGYNYYVFDNAIEYNGETTDNFLLSGYSYYLPDYKELNIVYDSALTDDFCYFTVFFDEPFEGEDPSGINTVIAADSNKVYDLAGRRVVKAQKGLNIVNGKVILK